MRLPFNVGGPVQRNFDFLAGQSKVAFPFAAGFTNVGGALEDATYSKHGRTVSLQGLVTKTVGTITVGDVLGTLPDGARPTGTLLFPVQISTSTAGASNVGRLDVLANGDVTFNAGTVSGGDFLSFSGILFVAA